MQVVSNPVPRVTERAATSPRDEQANNGSTLYSQRIYPKVPGPLKLFIPVTIVRSRAVIATENPSTSTSLRLRVKDAATKFKNGKMSQVTFDWESHRRIGCGTLNATSNSCVSRMDAACPRCHTAPTPQYRIDLR